MPLSDEFGTEFALNLSDGFAGILALVKNDYFEQICCKLEPRGILTLGKPTSHQAVYSAIRLLTATYNKIAKLEKKNRTLKEKMADIRIVNRAKWLLIEHLSMAEDEAHYYIEKQSMDTRMSRKEIAENVIRTYDK